jgi:hypothetical protein
MNGRENAASDAFHTHVFWLDDWLTRDKVTHFADQDQHAIFDKMTASAAPSDSTMYHLNNPGGGGVRAAKPPSHPPSSPTY